LIHRKVKGLKKGKLESGEVEFHSRLYRHLVEHLETAALHSLLPDEPNCRDAPNALLVRVRLSSDSPISGAARDFIEKG
jgi:hypothetical protein